ncbi:MAG: DUF362 domain-containing protein, partial [Clostridia bacterium]|nr:DUF362 domain-containing protein [Clostridia bacterium]
CGDSPGGFFTPATLSNVYRVCGMSQVEEAGATLNRDCSQETVSFPDAMVAKSFPYTSWLKKADVIFNLCKLKTHGMMGLSCGAKNMFGVVPGVAKPEFHYLYPDHRDFARMILDLDEYTAPVYTICDAVWGMEGNGPTGGTPRHIGCILVSPSPHHLDLVAAALIGLQCHDVPTLEAALERGLVPEHIEDLAIAGDYKAFIVPDYQIIQTGERNLFSTNGHRGMKKVVWQVAGKLLAARPFVHRDECIKCGKCQELCPAKAILVEKKGAKICKSDCIRCFCCQEFCPVSAITVKRTWIARWLTPDKKGESEKE